MPAKKTKCSLSLPIEANQSLEEVSEKCGVTKSEVARVAIDQMNVLIRSRQRNRALTPWVEMFRKHMKSKKGHSAE